MVVPEKNAQRNEASADELLTEATAAYRRGRFAEAEALARRALIKEPRNPSLWNARGVFLRSAGNAERAVDCYRQAIELAPYLVSAWANLGNALKDLKHVETAIACHHRALHLAPDNATFHHNLGVALTAAGRHRDALAAYEQALLRRPRDAKVRWDRGLAHLHLGELAEGWWDYEARLETGQLPKRALPGQCWRGERFSGQRLLILAEQGFGDAIWAARYLPLVKRLGGELVIECRPELLPLIDSIGAADRFILQGEALPEAEWHCHICSVPGLFTPDAAAIPQPPYVTAPSEREGKFDAAMQAARKRFRVGIVWSGSVTFGQNRDRAVPLTHFLRAFSLPGVQLYSLQKGPPAAELTAARGAPIIDLAPLLGDFADTAAAVAQLDLVIMTDSAVGHLAGAMGRPVWLLLSFVPYWLWQSDGSESPWYPSLRLFRPRSSGDWDTVFDAAAAQLILRSASLESGR